MLGCLLDREVALEGGGATLAVGVGSVVVVAVVGVIRCDRWAGSGESREKNNSIGLWRERWCCRFGWQPTKVLGVEWSAVPHGDAESLGWCLSEWIGCENEWEWSAPKYVAGCGQWVMCLRGCGA